MHKYFGRRHRTKYPLPYIALTVGVAGSYLRKNDYEKAGVLGRRRDLQGFGAMALLGWPCQFTTSERVRHSQDAVPFSGKPRPSYTVNPKTAIRGYCSVIAFRTTTSYEVAISSMPRSS